MVRKVLLLTVLQIIILSFSAKTQPMSVQYYNMGQEALLQGDLFNAETQYTRAIELNENYAEAYAQRGWVRWFSNRAGLALRDYNKAILLKPEIITTKNLRKVFGQLFEDYNEVIDDFNYTITVYTSDY